MNTNKNALRKERGLIITIISKNFESKIEDLKSQISAANKKADEATSLANEKGAEKNILQKQFSGYKERNDKAVGRMKFFHVVYFIFFILLFIPYIQQAGTGDNFIVKTVKKITKYSPAYERMYRGHGYYTVYYTLKPEAINLVAYMKKGSEVKTLETSYQYDIDLKSFTLHDFDYANVSEFEIYAVSPDGDTSTVVTVYNNQGFLTTEKP